MVAAVGPAADQEAEAVDGRREVEEEVAGTNDRLKPKKWPTERILPLNSKLVVKCSNVH